MEVVMIRSMVIPCVLGVALSACARPEPRVAPPPQAPRDAPPIALSYRVERHGDSDGVVLTGRTILEPRRGDAGIEESDARSPAKSELRFDARQAVDGAILVTVRYREVAPDGSHIRWEPIVRVAPGVPARAQVAGSGWSRTIEVVAE
jgi:hypothetical protein